MKWTGWLFDNLGLKIFALLLALLLYLHVYTDRTVEETLYFPLQLEQLPDSLTLASTPPASVGVRLRGTGKQLLRLRYFKPPFKLSLAAVTPGTFQRALAATDVPLAGTGDVSVIGVIDPAELRIDVARRAVRDVPVVVPVTGVPARGRLVSGPIEIRPAGVRLSGPAPWVARQETLRTEAISIAGRRDTLELVQAVTAPPAWAHATPGSVFVRVPIEEAAERTFSLQVEVRGIRPELRADPHPSTIDVTWRGPASLAAGVDAQANRAVVDAARRGRGQFTLRFTLEGPDADLLVPASDSVRVVLR
jgi:YbbR domain-containing protein